jgi:hypothetical protein
MKKLIDFFICPLCQQHLSGKSGLVFHFHRKHKLSNNDIELTKNKMDFYNLITKADQSKSLKLKQPLSEKYGNEWVQNRTTKTEQTNITKYGVKNVYQAQFVKDKSKQTMLKHHNVEFAQQSQIIQNKTKLANIEQFGVEYPLQNPEVLKKFREDIMTKYGVTNPYQIPHVQNNMKKAHQKQTFEDLKRFSDMILPLFNIDEYQKTSHHILYRWKCVKCSHEFESPYVNGRMPRCHICFPNNLAAITIAQQRIIDFLNHLNVKIIINDRSLLNPLEIDMLCLDKKLAIEYNGIYWHSELNGKNYKYHLHKTEACKAAGYRLIHIFEDEWINKRKIVLSRLRNAFHCNKYAIHGRKCIIKQIDTKLTKIFLTKYHIQSHGNCNICYGAFYKNRLVAVMTFCKKRLALGNRKEQVAGHYELERFATIPNFTIHGIANKILSKFEIDHNPSELISYADRRWSEGGVYKQLGFILDHISGPNYWYFDKSISIRYHRFNFRKNVLKNKLSKFDPNISEWQNMQANGYDRIWDCGNLVFKKQYNNSLS